jgi:hypothetical protein
MRLALARVACVVGLTGLVGVAACGSSSSAQPGGETSSAHPVASVPDAGKDGASDAGTDATQALTDGGTHPGTDGATDAGTGPGSGDAASAVDSGSPPVDAGAAHCKRGMATNTAPSAAFAPTAALPGVSWWYNWSAAGSGGSAGNAIEFVPMIWGSGSLKAALPAGSRYVLGFNEPNFTAQSDLTPQQAAADWPSIETSAKAAGIPLVSPAVNFCGSATDTSQCSDPAVTDPYTYLKDFFAACTGCEVDYVAVHWYNCDLPSLQAYLEGNVDAGGTLQGFAQFGKPLWLTEFSCDTTHSVADQTAYMKAAVPYLESNPNVFRYSWFSASAIPNAQLANTDGSPTALGTTYVGLAQSCP